MNYLKNFLVGLSLILSYQSSAQDNLLVPRSVVEWCVECDTKVKILVSIEVKKDSTINDQKLTIDKLEKVNTSLKEDSVRAATQISNLTTINNNKNTESTLLVGEIKRLKRQRNGERVGGTIIIIILTGLLFL